MGLNENSILITWLGQAGFMIKDSRDFTVIIDPYLTDSCERLVGFKRLSASPFRPDQLKCDLLVATHHHQDHLDIDAVPALMKSPTTRLIGSRTAVAMCRDMGFEEGRLVGLDAGGSITADGIQIKAVFADHGELAPDALGVILKVNGITIYFTGDTAYAPGRMQDAACSKPDILILPINGAYGNLGSEDAARLAADTGAGVVIPCHFWTFREHGGNPQEFEDMMKSRGLGDRVRFLTPGEAFGYSK